jgi:hypothetical protein
MSVFEWTDYETMDVLLRRDWFVDEQAIYELLWTADEPTYAKIYANRRAYSNRVKQVLCPEYFRIDAARLRWSVSESHGALGHGSA